MKKRVRQAAMRLMLLQEEFTKSELDEAVAFLSEGNSHDLMGYLRESRPPASYNSAVTPEHGTERNSKVVQDLASVDPERHRILVEFETMIRNGTVLPSLDDIKRLGTSVSKDFNPGRSRKESIPRLLATLSVIPMDEMKDAIRKATERVQSSEERGSSYERLAHFLIGGDQARH